MAVTIYQTIPLSAHATDPALNPSITTAVAGRTLVMMFSTASLVTDATPTDSTGDVWSKAFFTKDTVGTGVDVVGVMAYYRLNASTGVHNLTWAGNVGGYCEGSLLETDKMSALQIVGTETLGQDTITTLTAANTSVNGPALVFAMISVSGQTGLANAAISIPSGYTSLFTQNNTTISAGAEHAYREATISGNQNATWTFGADTTNTHYSAIIFAFSEPTTSSTAILQLI